jgi:hypothetical protein
MDDINNMSHIYSVKPITIWINTPKEIAESRVVNDSSRSSRIEDSSIKRYFDIILTPTNDSEKDSAEFIKLIQSLIIT